MQKIKLSLIAILCIIQLQAEQQIAYLCGGSCSGKSSLTRYIAEYNDWKVVASLYWDYLPEILKERFPEQHSRLTAVLSQGNITNAILRNFIIFDAGATDEQKEVALEAIAFIREHLIHNEKIYDVHMQEFRDYTHAKLQAALASDASILIDLGWYVSPEEVQELTSCKVTRFLIYCPLEDIIKRTLQRNEDADVCKWADNRRYSTQGLNAFLQHYDLTVSSDNAIDTISQESVERSLQLLAPYVNDVMTFAAFEQMKADLLHNFEQASTLYVVPRIPYDVVVNTHILTPLEAAQKIIEHLN